jgi:hypothetical protein
VNAPKRKGTAWESAVVAYLTDNGFSRAERRALSGFVDRGDIAGVPRTVIECKAAKAMDLAGWIKEAEAEAVNAGAEVPVVFAKRRQHGTADGYAICTIETFVRLLRQSWP